MERTTKHRLTPQRLAVLEAIRNNGHLSASEVWERARTHQSRISFATVYNALHYLCNAGLVLEIPFGSGATIYDGRVDPHEHAMCRECGRIVDYHCGCSNDLAECCREQTGFTNTEARTTVIGTCPDCVNVEQLHT